MQQNFPSKAACTGAPIHLYPYWLCNLGVPLAVMAVVVLPGWQPEHACCACLHRALGTEAMHQRCSSLKMLQVEGAPKVMSRSATSMRIFVDVDSLVDTEYCSCWNQLRAAMHWRMLRFWQRHEEAISLDWNGESWRGCASFWQRADF